MACLYRSSMHLGDVCVYSQISVIHLKIRLLAHKGSECRGSACNVYSQSVCWGARYTNYDSPSFARLTTVITPYTTNNLSHLKQSIELPPDLRSP